MAHYYHEPGPFRYRLGAFIQAARNVTFMLQSEKSAFQNFDWYEAWREEAKADVVLCWLNDTRIGVVHRGALEPNSWMEMRCIDNPRHPHGTEAEDDEDPFRFHVNPFICTHNYIAAGAGPWGEDHPHEFERHWEMQGLGGRELLEVCADVYDRLDALVQQAHTRLGANWKSFRREGSSRALPCMEDILKHRIVRTSMRDGREVWENEPQGLHRH